jgi:hypothetical protein
MNLSCSEVPYEIKHGMEPNGGNFKLILVMGLRTRIELRT